jgi:hypothetical protein
MIEKRAEEFERITGKLPTGWEAKAKELGAITRSRKIKDAKDLLQLILLYLTSGESFGRTAALTRISEGLRLTKNAVFERFLLSGAWLAWMCENICRNAGLLAQKPEWLWERRVCLVDATDESIKGSKSADWRLHYMVELFTLDTVETHLTNAKKGETLVNFSKIKSGDIVIADRAYGTITSIEHVLDYEADYIVRIRANAFNLYEQTGEKLDFREKIKDMKEGESAEYTLQRLDPHKGRKEVSLCVYRKTTKQCADSIRQIKKSNTKKMRGEISELQEFYGKYVIVATSLHAPCEQILELYRMRWQVELLFKRLKSIFEYNKVPVKNETSVRAWLNGKLLLAAICETLVNEGRFFPCEERTSETF